MRGAGALVLTTAALFLTSCERATGPPPPERARRVVPASATACDLVGALLPVENVVAVPAQAEEHSTWGRQVALDAELPRFPSYLAEPILRVAPDLVVVDAYQSEDTSRRLAEAGISLHRLPVIDDLDGAWRALTELGVALGRSDEAARLIEGQRQRREALAAAAATRRSWRVLAYSNFSGQGWTAGGGTTLDSMLTLAGLTNAGAEGGKTGHRRLTHEELLAIDPELLLIGAGPVEGAVSPTLTLLRDVALLEELSALRDERVVVLPSHYFSTASHEILGGAELLAAEVAAREPSLR
ncbi:MAG: ABC transporter substrate-binding protein [Acidobacteriota bacterium]